MRSLRPDKILNKNGTYQIAEFGFQDLQSENISELSERNCSWIAPENRDDSKILNSKVIFLLKIDISLVNRKFTLFFAFKKDVFKN